VLEIGLVVREIIAQMGRETEHRVILTFGTFAMLPIVHGLARVPEHRRKHPSLGASPRS